jgi:hypothetical protein
MFQSEGVSVYLVMKYAQNCWVAVTNTVAAISLSLADRRTGAELVWDICRPLGGYQAHH